MQIIVDGMLTHYERAGTGKIILILPGWADTSVSWLPFQKNLSQGFDVIVLDNPGFGGSQQSNVPWKLDDYTQFVSHFLHKLAIKKVYAVVGHSNGGAIAVRALSTSQITSEKLLLVASAGIRSVQQGRKSVLRFVAKTGKALSKPMPKSVQAKLRSRLYTSVGSDMLVAEHMQETFKNIVGEDVQDDARHITIPTLLVYGDKDQETPVRYGEMLHALIKHSELQLVPNADHFIHLHATDKLLTICKGFLR